MKKAIKKLRTIKQGIKNLLYWIPVIWNDRNYDQEYLLIIMRHKLSSMEKYFSRKNALVLDSYEMANEIREIVEVLDRLISNSYFKEWDNASLEAIRMRQEDKKRLGEILLNNLDRWWD